MGIIPYEPAVAPELASLYNSLIPSMPYCYPVSVEDFASALNAPTDAVFVARDGVTPRGFVHVAIHEPEEADEEEEGMIRFLLYEPGQRPAGQALLVAAEEHLRERGMKRITAFHQDYRYPFYHIGHAYLSDRVGQVHALMGLNGYERYAGEVYLDWANYEPVAPAPIDIPADISLHWEQGSGRLPNLTVQACQDGEEIGECVNLSCGEFTRAEEAQDWLLTKWLGVEDEFQGQGLGRHLLRRALLEMHAVGYRHATISTGWTNHRACLFYCNCGYHIVDWTYALTRDIS